VGATGLCGLWALEQNISVKIIILASKLKELTASDPDQEYIYFMGSERILHCVANV